MEDRVAFISGGKCCVTRKSMIIRKLSMYPRAAVNQCRGSEISNTQVPGNVSYTINN